VNKKEISDDVILCIMKMALEKAGCSDRETQGVIDVQVVRELITMNPYIISTVREREMLARELARELGAVIDANLPKE